MAFKTLFLLCCTYVAHGSFILRGPETKRRSSFVPFPTRLQSDGPACQPLFSFPTDTILVGGVSSPGSDPDRPSKVNQDAYFHFQQEEYVFACVMDGHGVKGHEVTAFLQEQLPLRIKQLLDETVHHDDELQELRQKLIDLGHADPTEFDVKGRIPRVLMDAFHQSHFDACSNTKIPSSRSGTACIVCALDQNTRQLWTAHAGDSRAILACSQNATGTSRALSQETTTRVPEEKARIESCEGSIVNSNVFYGPVGIAMTRALGDSVMLRAGVLPTPLIEETTVSSGDFVVLGTDGVFDVLTNDRVANLVTDACSAQAASESVASQAQKAWKGGLPLEVKVDDITCVVIQC